MSADKKSKTPTGPGTRIAGAKRKGSAAAEKGKPKSANPYSDTRPKMVAAWDEGHAEFTAADTQAAG